MRFIPTSHLKPGQKLASDLELSTNRVLLRRGAILKASIIRKISNFGFQGIYIDDELSEGIEITDVISHDLKVKTKKELESLFYGVKNNLITSTVKQIKSIKRLVHDIVNEISHNRNVMVNIIDLRSYDDYTYSHSLNVAVISAIIGTAMKLSWEAINELTMGALIHDLGKMFVNKDILNKPGKLTDDEFEEMKRHSFLGYEYVRNRFDIAQNSKLTALQHHEKYNGSGYPGGLAGKDIHPYSRIVCVADVYDALSSDRPYRKAMLPSDVMEYIMGGYNTMFDPEIVSALTRKVAPYPVGTCLRLSTGDLGIVVENRESTGLRPVLRLIVDNKPTSRYIDLANDRDALNITIKEIINY